MRYSLELSWKVADHSHLSTNSLVMKSVKVVILHIDMSGINKKFSQVRVFFQVELSISVLGNRSSTVSVHRYWSSLVSVRSGLISIRV